MAKVSPPGQLRLDVESESLFSGRDPVRVGKRAVAVLRALIEHAGEPVSKDALIAAAWSGLAIEENNLSVQIAALRRALGEAVNGARWIETLPRRGYRYVGPLIPVTGSAGTPARSATALSGKPSVALLPFASHGAEPEHARFADGMVEDVITALSRFKSLFVIARNSSFAYRGRTLDIKQVGRELGVRYVVDGSIRTSRTGLRVAVQLIDADNGFQLWSERYDRKLTDAFAVQDEIARAIVSVLPGRLEGAGRDVAIRKQTSSMTAYDLVLLGNEQWRRLNRRALVEARERFRTAAALDPTYARAHANIAWTTVCGAFLEAASAAALDEALVEIETALDIDNDDAWSHGVFAQLLFLRREDERSELHFKRALALNPNDADVAAVFGNILVYWGRWREALVWIETAKQLNPFAPNLYHWYHALALYAGRRYRDAIETLRQARALHCWSHGLLAACYARLGLRDDARSELNRFVTERRAELEQNGEAAPDSDLDLVQVRVARYRKAEDRKHLLDGLRKAGLGATPTHRARAGSARS